MDNNQMDAIHRYYLSIANKYAADNSTCLKVAVGSVFVGMNNDIYYASNCGKKSCKEIGECYKFKVTGIYKSCEETRPYCAAIHSEINMINQLREKGIGPWGTIYVTRYPCLNCAINLAAYGFKDVVYGGRQEISEDVKKIFDDNEISYKWYPDIDFEK